MSSIEGKRLSDAEYERLEQLRVKRAALLAAGKLAWVMCHRGIKEPAAFVNASYQDALNAHLITNVKDIEALGGQASHVYRPPPLNQFPFTAKSTNNTDDDSDDNNGGGGGGDNGEDDDDDDGDDDDDDDDDDGDDHHDDGDGDGDGTEEQEESYINIKYVTFPGAGPIYIPREPVVKTFDAKDNFNLVFQLSCRVTLYLGVCVV